MRFAAVLFAVVILVAGCATTPPPLATPPYVSQLRAADVAPDTLRRIEAGRVLTFADVRELVRAGIPGNKIVAYLRSTRAPYNFSQQQIDQLLSAGADSTLINYVGRAAGDFLVDAQNAQQQAELRQNAKWSRETWENAYFADPFFAGPAPFPYAFPPEWY